ncbi:MAG: DUF4956 domain-containing protein [Solobacterium sp.]|nr:DUF4956 domain-containing protein [Solobacterium sp.]
MFTSIFTGTSSGLQLLSVLTAFGISLLCGLVIALIYRCACRPSANLLMSIVVLPMIVAGVILMVNGSLGIGVAIAGSFSLVRFRSLPGKASDIAVVFLAMATGLACGTGYVTFALLMTLIAGFSLWLVTRLPFLQNDPDERILKVTIPEDLDSAGLFTDILNQYTVSWHQEGLKTVNLGAMYQITYRVCLKSGEKEKEMLDQIRVRNGNLTVASHSAGLGSSEL